MDTIYRVCMSLVTTSLGHAWRQLHDYSATRLFLSLQIKGVAYKSSCGPHSVGCLGILVKNFQLPRTVEMYVISQYVWVLSPVN